MTDRNITTDPDAFDHVSDALDWDPDPIEPAWALLAADEGLRADVCAAASCTPGGDTARVLELACPSGAPTAVGGVTSPGRSAAEPTGLGSTQRVLIDRTTAAVRAHATDPGASGERADATGESPVRVGPAGLDAAGLLHGIAGLARVINWAQAMQQRYMAALARPGVVLPVDDLLDVAASPLGLAQPVPDAPTAAITRDPAWAAAVQEAAIKVASAEIGCALNLSPMTARNRTQEAVTMVDTLPATIAAQQAGHIDRYRASIIADRTDVLPADQRRLVEQEVLPFAAKRTPGRLRTLVDRQVARLDPDAAAARERHARKNRGTRVDTDHDGMATFCATVTAPDAQVAQHVLDRIAVAVSAAGLADGRGRSQLRADAFTALFHDLASTGQFTIPHGQPGSTGPTDSPTEDSPTDEPAKQPAEQPAAGDGIPTGQSQPDDHDKARATDPYVGTDEQPTTDRDTASNPAPVRRCTSCPPTCVNVYVNAETLAGWDDEPGELAGHGIISADLARTLAESARSVRAIITSDPPDTPRGLPPGTPRPSVTSSAEGHSRNTVRSRYCGTVFDAGTEVYRPSRRTADRITSRDRTCQFPGCRAAAHRCDLDHRVPFRPSATDTGSRTGVDRGLGAGREPVSGGEPGSGGDPGRGATCPCNIDTLCRFHHLIKTFTPWHATPGDDGTLVWTSPLRHRYPTEPSHPLHDDNPSDTISSHTDPGQTNPSDTNPSLTPVGSDGPPDSEGHRRRVIDPPPF